MDASRTFCAMDLLCACAAGQISFVWKHLEQEDFCRVGTKHERKWAAALQLACASGHEDCVRLMLSRGVDPFWKDDYGMSPIDFLCLRGAERWLRVLLPSNKRVAFPRDRKSPLWHACASGHEACARFLLEREVCSADSTPSPLVCACRGGHEACARLLLEHGAPVAAPCNQQSALCVACAHGHDRCVQLLLDNNADVSAVDANGNNPVACACYGDQGTREGRLACLRLLLQRGASADARGIRRGVSARVLRDACLHGDEDMVRLLLDHGASPHRRRGEIDAPLVVACAAGHEGLVRMLVTEYGVDVSHRARMHMPLHEACGHGQSNVVALLLDHGANPHAKDSRGNTSLLRTVWSGNAECARLLLKAGADVDATNDRGTTPLMAACTGCHLSDVGFRALARQLIRAGADANHRDAKGASAIRESARASSHRGVQMLLRHGADPDGAPGEDLLGVTPPHDPWKHVRDKSALIQVMLIANNVGRTSVRIAKTERATREFALAIGRNTFIERVEVKRDVAPELLALMWDSPSLCEVVDYGGTHRRPRAASVRRFVEGERVRVLETRGCWTVSSVGDGCALHLQGDRGCLVRVSFANMTPVNPAWHEVDLAIARGARSAAVRALDPRRVGFVVRRRVEAFL